MRKVFGRFLAFCLGLSLTSSLLAITCLLLAGPSVSAQEAKELKTLTWPDFAGPMVGFAPDGKTLAVVSSLAPATFHGRRTKSELKLLDVGAMKERAAFILDGAVSSWRFSPDGKTLAVGGGGWSAHQPLAGKLALWDVATGKQRLSLAGHAAGPVGGIAFTPDGKTLATGDGGVSGEVKLWDAVSGKELATTIRGHDPGGEVLSMAFSPDGKLLASESGSRLKVWDVATGKERDALKGLTGRIQLFTPDRKTLITTGCNPGDTITLWDVSAGKELRTLKMDGAVYCCVALTADGRVLASSGTFQTAARNGRLGWEGHESDLKLWDPATGKELASLKWYGATIGSLAFSADGKVLAAGGGTGGNGNGGQVQVWDVSGVHSQIHYGRDTKSVQSMAIAVIVGEPKIIFDQKKRQGLEGEPKKAMEQPPIAANVDDIKAALTKQLKDASAYTRLYAAEALWKIDNDPAAVAAMVADLKDTNLQVRQGAASALGRFGVGAKAAVPALTEALQDENSFVRSRVALALWQIDKHPDAIPALVENLKGDHPSIAADALGQIGVAAKAAVPLLREALKDYPPAPDPNIALALWKINKDASAVPTLIAALKYPYPDWRMNAANYLGIIGVEAKAAVPALIEALNDEKQFVRESAAKALGAIGVEAIAAVPALLEALKDKKDRGRVHAAEALWRINKHPAAVLALAAAVQDPMDQADHYAHVALRRIGVEARAAVPALTEALKAEKVYHRVEAAITLWQINKDHRVVPVLVQSLKDLRVNGPVRIASAVASMNTDLVGVPVLFDIPSVIDVDRSVRAYAAKALGEINEHPAAVSALVEALKDAGACADAAEALWQISKHPMAVPALIENFKSNSGGVFALGRIGAELQAAPALSKGQRP
jgi:WD40 repeat protein/HEAT repeat protein